MLEKLSARWNMLVQQRIMKVLLRTIKCALEHVATAWKNLVRDKIFNLLVGKCL